MRLLIRLRPSRTLSVAFVGFFLMISAWSIAVPYDGTPDEHDHVYRAIGVVSGDIAPKPEPAVRGSGAFQTIPAGFVASVCWQWERPRTPADCPGAEPTADRTPVRVGSGAGRYQPVYYAIVGLPLKLWPGYPGLIIARLISGAIAAALLAAAVATIMRYSRHRLMMAGLLAAVTPMATYVAGSINPNGLEIAAGVAFFAAAIPLFTARMERIDPALIRLAGISALWLATLRSIGPVFLLCALVAFALPLGASNVRQLLRVREARWWAGAVVLAAAAALVWIVAMKAGDLGDFRTGYYTPGQAILAVAERWPSLFNQMVGMTSWLIFVFMPAPAYTVWLFLAAALLVFAVVFGTWVDRWRLVAVFSGGVLVPMVIQILYLNTTGWITQGRYLLPMVVGVMLLAANVLEERGLEPRRGVTLTRLTVVFLLPIHLLCLAVSMARWQRGLPKDDLVGISTLNPLGGQWQPPLGALLPLLIEVAGLAVLGWLAWTAYQRRPAPAAAADASADEPAAADLADLRTGTGGGLAGAGVGARSAVGIPTARAASNQAASNRAASNRAGQPENVTPDPTPGPER